MKLVKSKFEIIEQNPGLNGIYKIIELAGRTCYKSEKNITEDSANKFVDNIIKLGHFSVLEHGTVYLKIPVNIDVAGDFLDEVSIWTKCKLVEQKTGNWWAITLNYRVLIEHFSEEYIKYILENYLCEPTEFHEKRICVRFILPIGISREFCRHRSMSFAEMSTRYCNFSKDRFENEITCILPHDFSAPEGHIDIDRDTIVRLYGEEEAKKQEECPLTQIIYNYIDCEKRYMNLINSGCTPQIARDVLPLGLRSELVMTGFVSDWKHFFELRCDKTAHPQARELAIPLQEEFIKREYIK